MSVINPKNGQAFRKTQLIEVVGLTNNGDVVVQNQGKPEDQWKIERAIFDSTYEPAFPNTDKVFNFGSAIDFAKKGKKVARKGWNGKGMFIVFMPELKLPPHSSQEPGAKVNDRTAKHIGEDTPLDSQPYFAMWTAAKQWQPGWLASQPDMLAEDWLIVD